MNTHQTGITMLFGVILLIRGINTGYPQRVYAAVVKAVTP